MAWQGDYYYRKRRQGDTVVSEYVGTGSPAERRLNVKIQVNVANQQIVSQ